VESHDLLRLGAKGLLTYAEAPEELPRACTTRSRSKHLLPSLSRFRRKDAIPFESRQTTVTAP
jgi:hypothetical protein